MSEPTKSMPEEPFGDHERDILENLKDGIRHGDTLRSGVSIGEHMAIVGILARLDWCEAQLAALAPLQDLLADVREDNEMRRAAEIGAARERQGIIEALHKWARDHKTDTRSCVEEVIRDRGPCLPLPPDEIELARLRKIEAAARDMMKSAVGLGPLQPKYVELAEVLGMSPQVAFAFGDSEETPMPPNW